MLPSIGLSRVKITLKGIFRNCFKIIKCFIDFNCLACELGVTVFRESPSLAAKYIHGTYARKTVTPVSLPQLKAI